MMYSFTVSSPSPLTNFLPSTLREDGYSKDLNMIVFNLSEDFGKLEL